ncbi:phosphoribosyltransferase [Caenimonas terrae]|uniref:Phosphoribosyltransferase n=1 Tax=Caenimonas terrae TaxID=696074 RepID=A0ABW0NH42_9BURK
MNEMDLPYRDRRHAGRALAQRLEQYRGRSGLLVLALPRGGVPVGYEVARALAAPLDVCVVRKLGHPGHEEYAIGAIASGGVRVMNPLPDDEIEPAVLAALIAREQDELVRRERLYRGNRPAAPLRGRSVIVVDDGLATGASMRVALEAIRQQHPALLVAAAPVGSPQSCAQLADVADAVVCPATPSPFRAVGLWYREFAQVGDDEVRELLEQARLQHALEIH